MAAKTSEAQTEQCSALLRQVFYSHSWVVFRGRVLKKWLKTEMLDIDAVSYIILKPRHSFQ